MKQEKKDRNKKLVDERRKLRKGVKRKEATKTENEGGGGESIMKKAFARSHPGTRVQTKDSELDNF